jgi:hypothetical protein
MVSGLTYLRLGVLDLSAAINLLVCLIGFHSNEYVG